jgi:hypothetical protein
LNRRLGVTGETTFKVCECGSYEGVDLFDDTIKERNKLKAD